MPRLKKAMKGVAICDKPRGADKQALIRGFPNGETQLRIVVFPLNFLSLEIIILIFQNKNLSGK